MQGRGWAGAEKDSWAPGDVFGVLDSVPVLDGVQDIG